MRLVLLALLALASPARAESPEELDRAKNHFEAGRALFTLGEYGRAAREFEAGYKIAPRPRFLLNLGHCYRKLGERDKAIDTFKTFLSQVPENDPDRPTAARFLEELERERAAATAPPSPPPERATPPPVVAPLTTRTEPPRQKSGIRRYWWIIPVSAVVVSAIVIGAVVGATSSSTAEPDCSMTSLGCIDLR
jgi:tetratricopeptide (TPR) repeat protein